MEPNWDLLEQSIGYRFQDRNLLRRALTHKSFAPSSALEPADVGLHNERFEFFGDAILSFLTTETLLRRYPQAHEGFLSKVKNHLVSKNHLTMVARQIALGEHLLLGKGEEITGGRAKQKLLGNAMEAVIAAIYMDGGIAPVRDFVESLVIAEFDKTVGRLEEARNFKSELQELAKQRGISQPSYTVLAKHGPDHAKVFVVEAKIRAGLAETAEGSSIKLASQRAAAALLDRLAAG
ncbi:MAG: ribonuclease III [Bryobacterales bacterium]|jgi:ribonuclease-3|nr:ribonuclease III [Bryobacterales bacterium]